MIEPEEAKTVRFIFLAFIQGYNYEQIAMILTQKKRSTLRGRQEWNGMMVANIMKNERRWGDLEARKSIVVDYKLGKVTKNNGNRCSAYVPEHHEAIVSPEIARAAHLVASSKKKCGVQDIVVIQQGALKGFVGIHPNWSGMLLYWNIMLNYADLNLNQSGQYGQIYAEKFTSASLICKVFYGKMKAQWGKYTLLLNLL